MSCVIYHSKLNMKFTYFIWWRWRCCSLGTLSLSFINFPQFSRTFVQNWQGPIAEVDIWATVERTEMMQPIQQLCCNVVIQGYRQGESLSGRPLNPLNPWDGQRLGLNLPLPRRLSYQKKDTWGKKKTWQAQHKLEAAKFQN